MNDKERDKSFSKSDFDLSGDESNESTQMTDGTLGLSNFDFDVIFSSFFMEPAILK